MKILDFKAANILNLKVVEISPDGNVITLTGANCAGKSAVLDAIEIALTGKKPEQLIRRGEKKGMIELNTGEYKIKRIYTEKTDRIELSSADGVPCKSPQALLDKIVGNLSFDPLSFRNMGQDEQKKFLSGIVGLNFTKEEASRKELYDDRTLVGRDITKKEGSLAEKQKPKDGLPEKETSIEEKLAAINAMREKKAAHNSHVEDVQKIDRDIAEKQRTIESHERQISALKSEISDLHKEKESMVEPENATEEQITEAVAEVTATSNANDEIRSAREYRETEADLAKAKTEYNSLTQSIEKIDQDKAVRIKNAKYPIEGLAIGEDSVTYKDIPFRQLSSGEAMRVSTAIAMALNPNLRIIMVRDATLLDNAGLKAITEMAKEKDYQLWVERLDESGKVGVFLEDGEIIENKETKE